MQFFNEMGIWNTQYIKGTFAKDLMKTILSFIFYQNKGV